MTPMPLYRLLIPLACLLLTGCGGMFSGGQGASTPPPAPSAATAAGDRTSDVMRVGDKITIRLTGVPDDGYLIEVQIPASGGITVPLLNHPFQAVGRNAGDLASEIAQAYRAGQIYTSPNVTVIPEERYVNVGGDVRQPARVIYTSDLTLLSAINSCGGFTDYANRRKVRILRGQQVIQVDATAAARTPGADPPLFAGDQVYVPRTMF
jgi:protein involved in polysaccharide export with SLBB domain